jgi:hypothetical protein
MPEGNPSISCIDPMVTLRQAALAGREQPPKAENRLGRRDLFRSPAPIVDRAVQRSLAVRTAYTQDRKR